MTVFGAVRADATFIRHFQVSYGGDVWFEFRAEGPETRVVFGWAVIVAQVVVLELRLCGRARGARGESKIAKRAPVQDFRLHYRKRFWEDVYVVVRFVSDSVHIQSGQFSILIGG